MALDPVKVVAMNQSGLRLKTNWIDPASIRADKSRFDEIVADMATSAGPLTPTTTWLTLEPCANESTHQSPRLDQVFSEDEFNTKFSSMDKMLGGWIGSGQMPSIDERSQARYADVLAHHDPLSLWRENVLPTAVRSRLGVGDLGSIMDLNLLYSFRPTNPQGPTSFLEVGGGYGRLAEAALNVFGESIRYVMVDSVPGSLYYAREYLSRACPEARIGSYYNGDPFDLQTYSCFIVPAWHFERLNTQTYDVCVNIESFQEMSQIHVDYFLALFARVTREGSLVYVSNAHDYLFQGDWNYPDTWQKLLCTNTPRSWTPDHPTEVLSVRTGDFRLANSAINEFYRNFETTKTLRQGLSSTGRLLTERLRQVLRR